MMLSGIPNLQMMHFVNRAPNSTAVSPVVVGIKFACLVRWSTTMKIVLNSSDHGKCTMKSIEMDE